MGYTRLQVVGVLGTLLAVVGYALGVLVAYPGRELSLAVGMVAITVLALGGFRGDGP